MEAMTGEILHMADISTNLMADPSQQIIVESSRQTGDTSGLKDHLESLTEAQL